MKIINGPRFYSTMDRTVSTEMNDLSYLLNLNISMLTQLKILHKDTNFDEITRQINVFQQKMDKLHTTDMLGKKLDEHIQIHLMKYLQK